MKTKRKQFQELSSAPFDAELPTKSTDRRLKIVKLPTEPLSDEDRLHVRFDRRNGRMVGFAVQYECRIGNDWHAVIRIDASPAEKPHQHVFHPNPRKNRKEVLVGESKKYGEIFHEAMRHLRTNFKNYKDNYVRAYEQS